MNATTCSPSLVQEMFRSLLNTAPPLTTPNQRLSVPKITPQPLTSPPSKNSIRYIENDQNNRREKYDGCRWRLVCTWNMYECTNLAYTRQFCNKHSALQRNKILPAKKKKVLLASASVPIMSHHTKKKVRIDHDDDDIQILEEYCKQATMRHSVNSNVKLEAPDFNVFSVEHLDDTDFHRNVKSEPTASSTYRSSTKDEIEYVSSTTRSNGLNIAELISKHIPPLTEFEEDCLANRLMAKFPTTCLMLDAQLFLQNEAIIIVKRNYRLKMDIIAPEYFFDFLLRHPRLALHYSNWFSRCKPTPPNTGCPIDLKVWTISMTVRGAMASDNMIDEHDG